MEFEPVLHLVVYHCNLNDYDMKNFRIESPCKENWNEMTATEKGAFCQKCSSEVHDFTNKTNDEIRSVLRANIGNKVCGRYTDVQQESLNADFEVWQNKSQRTVQRAMLFSLVIVFGLTLFSCNSEKEEKALTQVQIVLTQISAATQVFEVATKQRQIGAADNNNSESYKIEAVNQKIEQIRGEELNIERQDLILVDSSNDDITIYDREYTMITMGAQISSSRFIKYLEQEYISPIEPNVIELDENGREFPTEFDSKVYPNPAAEATTLEIKSPVKQEQIVIALYDMSGSYLQPIHEGEMNRGTHTYQLNLIDLKPGIYLIVINSNGYKETTRISKF